MKSLYSFNISRTLKKEVPYVKKNKNNENVESTKVVTSKIENKVIFAKPSFADIEEAEFFYGQKYNEFINSGFLTKAMLNKKIGDIGGSSSKLSDEIINKAFLDHIESAKIIEFYDEKSDLNDEQKEKLQEAKLKFFESQKIISEFESIHRSQYSQTAEAKAEQKIIEWFLLNFSFYEEKIGENTERFPLFVGDTYDEKREHYLQLCEDEDTIEDVNLLKNKSIFDNSFNTLVKVVNIWYNKLGSNQEEIDQKIKEVFADE